MNSKLIVALDFNNKNDALRLVDSINPNTCALKVGNEMFTLLGTDFVQQLINRNFKVFLDLKYHDIPNTVARACYAAAELGVWMLNVHASGGLKMMRAAMNALQSYGSNRPILIAVTVLTSFDGHDLSTLGVTLSLIDQVKNLALMTKEAGLDGVVCSAHEVGAIKKICGTDFLAITPGIRLMNDAVDDQTRVMTPQQAIQEGSDYLVVGRPITQATHPAKVIDNLLMSLSGI